MEINKNPPGRSWRKAALMLLLATSASASQPDAGTQESPGLVLSYNKPFRLQKGSSARLTTTQAISLLGIQNLSTSHALTYSINAGAVLATVGSLPANDPTPKLWMVKFNGSELLIANLSSGDAIMQVTLLST